LLENKDLQEGDLAGKSLYIQKTSAIVNELSGSVNFFFLNQYLKKRQYIDKDSHLAGYSNTARVLNNHHDN
jgi:hypothetical protein